MSMQDIASARLSTSPQSHLNKFQLATRPTTVSNLLFTY